MRFSVPEMSCGHCIAAIEKSIKARDAQAEVSCDLATRRVEIRTGLSQAEVSAAMQQAGYETTPLAG